MWNFSLRKMQQNAKRIQQVKVYAEARATLLLIYSCVTEVLTFKDLSGLLVDYFGDAIMDILE